jgi:hypothetical protein
MPIKFRCPTCNAVIKAPSKRAGHKVGCPGCSQRLQIPAPGHTILAHLVQNRNPVQPPAPPKNDFAYLNQALPFAPRPDEGSLEKALLRSQDLTHACVITVVLYVFFSGASFIYSFPALTLFAFNLFPQLWIAVIMGWLPGFTANIVYLSKAHRIKRITGESPPGSICLQVLLFVFGLIPLGGLGILMMEMRTRPL